MEYYRGLFDPWAAHTDHPDRAIGGGDAVAVEITFTGTTHEGREISFPAVDVFDLQEGKISRLAIFYDLAWLRKQMA